MYHIWANVIWLDIVYLCIPVGKKEAEIVNLEIWQLCSSQRFSNTTMHLGFHLILAFEALWRICVLFFDAVSGCWQGIFIRLCTSKGLDTFTLSGWFVSELLSVEQMVNGRWRFYLPLLMLKMYKDTVLLTYQQGISKYIHAHIHIVCIQYKPWIGSREMTYIHQ